MTKDASVPVEIEAERRALAEVILHEGFLPSRADYAAKLGGCDLVVSTARHEFFGVSVLEAMSAGATPLLPDRLSYPEVVGEDLAGEALYRGEDQLVRQLARHARDPGSLREPAGRARWRARAERWSIAGTAEELDAFCEKLASSRASMLE